MKFQFLVYPQDVGVIRLYGELDHHETEKVRNQLSAVILQGQVRTLIWNLEHLKFMDSSGIGLVWSIVQRFSSRGVELEDLFQIGCIGLMKSVDKFDLSYEVKFSTYAVPMIIGEIQRYLRDDGMVKVSRSIRELNFKIRHTTEQYLKENESPPTILQLADMLNVTVEEIVMAIDVGLFSAEAVLYTAIAALFSFAIPNYELGVSVKIFRHVLLAATALLGVNGLFIAGFLLFMYIASLKPMRVPYLWPLLPFFPRAFMRVIVRFPVSNEAIRPYVTGSKKRDREANS